VPVVVSIAPQQYFVERVGGEHVQVTVMVPPGAEPHTIEPKPNQLKALSQAKVYFPIGIEFEQAWMDKFRAANPRMQIVDTTVGIERLPLTSEEQAEEHSASSPHPAPQGQSQAAHLDPHIWLSPRLVKIQAQTIAQALMQLDPQHQGDYQANLQRFLADLDALDARIRKTLAGATVRQFIVFHPAWGYFARDYQLEQIPIEVGGQEPSAAELADLIRRAQQAKMKVVFAEPQFSQQAARTIAQEIGGEVLLINDLSPDWLNNLNHVADTFAQVLQRDRRQSLRPFFPTPAQRFRWGIS
jgi:zinc transport system substrate-binding protein